MDEEELTNPFLFALGQQIAAELSDLMHTWTVTNTYIHMAQIHRSDGLTLNMLGEGVWRSTITMEKVKLHFTGDYPLDCHNRPYNLVSGALPNLTVSSSLQPAKIAGKIRRLLLPGVEEHLQNARLRAARTLQDHQDRTRLVNKIAKIGKGTVRKIRVSSDPAYEASFYDQGAGLSRWEAKVGARYYSYLSGSQDTQEYCVELKLSNLDPDIAMKIIRLITKENDQKRGQS